jgi:hypothetical protein
MIGIPTPSSTNTFYPTRSLTFTPSNTLLPTYKYDKIVRIARESKVQILDCDLSLRTIAYLATFDTNEICFS